MSRFPFFKEIRGLRALIAGGGEVALRRARALADSGAEIVCVAPEFCAGFEALPAVLVRREFEESDLTGCGIVVAATDDRSVNSAVAAMAREQGCEVNVSDCADEGTFQFPAVVRRGGMTVAVSSGGASPAAAKYVRERIEEAIPDHFEAVLATLEMARTLAKAMIPQQKERAHVLRRIFDECLNAQAQPDEKALKDMIRRFCCTEVH